MRRTVSVAIVVSLLGLTATLPARAYCRTSSCELGEEDRADKCERDEHECVTEGKPLHWASPCIYYAVQRDGSPKSGIDADAFAEEVARAFEAWQNVTCPGGGSPRLLAQSQGFVSCHEKEAICGDADQNVHVMMLHDEDWPDDADVIGLTTPTGGTNSGLVVDADLEINAQDYDFSAGATGPNALSLRDVVTHEVGHFLGLSHSDADGALMSTGYDMVQLSRELLTDDDIAAICAAYPPGKPLSCPAPKAPAYDECQIVPGEPVEECKLASVTHRDSRGCGCSTPGGHDRHGVLWGGALLLGLLLRRRTSAHFSL